MNVRFLLIIGATALALTARPAQAHVTVVPASADAGGIERLTFRCPNERSNAGTISLVVQLPEDVAIPSVTVLDVPGWQSHVTMRRLATQIHTSHGDVSSVVDTITWDGGKLEPGSPAGLFPIMAGPLPDPGHPLVFKAVQTYDNGEVVRWIEDRVAGQPAPPFPAPQLVIHEK